jgi:hydrogenase maturation protease
MEHGEDPSGSRLQVPCSLLTAGLPMPRKSVVIGVGNRLLKDEGVGIHVLQALEKETLPPDVHLFDGGICGIGLLDFFQGASKALLIDAADMNRKPGTILRFTPETLRAQAREIKFSTHDIGVAEVLELAKALGQSPEEVVIIGIQPKEIDWGTELTPEVQASIPKVLQIIREEITRGQDAIKNSA